MAMNYKEVPQGLPDEEKARYAKGIRLVNNYVDSLRGEDLLPDRFVKAVESSTIQAGATETLRPRGLEPIKYAIEIPTVSEELYNRTREAVEATGYAFVAAIRSVSMEDLVTEDATREQRRIGYVSDSKTMRANVPPKMEVAINPARFRIEGSNHLSTKDQKEIIKKEEAEWKEKLPEDVRPLVSMRMVDPSTIAQLEDAYMDSTRKLLLPDFFARTDVQTVRGRVARVGRYVPSDRRDVDDWGRDNGNGLVFAVSVVVLPRKLAA